MYRDVKNEVDQKKKPEAEPRMKILTSVSWLLMFHEIKNYSSAITETLISAETSA